MANGKNLKIGVIVNDIEKSLRVQDTTILKMALEALQRDHKVWFMSIDSISYGSDEMVYANAATVSNKSHTTTQEYLDDLKQTAKKRPSRICVSKLDILLLRNDPSMEAPERSWARTIALDFGTLATKQGVIVLNNPGGLSKSRNKLYLQHYPDTIRPKTIVTRDQQEIKKFFQNRKKVILKPLSGSEGRNVFLAHQKDLLNINQMIEAVSRDGFVIAQEYLPASEKGDVRIFLMNGEPLIYNGQYAAFRRVKPNGDLRNNISVGAKPKKAIIDENILRLCDTVRPRLIQDGMFLVGLDIVGKKIIEINVFCPGGLGNIEKVTGINFAIPIIDALERKVAYRDYYKGKFDNNEMATL